MIRFLSRLFAVLAALLLPASLPGQAAMPGGHDLPRIVPNDNREPAGQLEEVAEALDVEDGHVYATAAPQRRVAYEKVVRAAACNVAEADKDASATDVLIALLEKGDEAAVTALAAIGSPEVARKLSEKIGEAPDALLAQALGKILLRKDLGKEDVYVQIVETLGKVPGDEAVSGLMEYLSAIPENPPRQSRTIQPGATLYVGDVLRDLFAREGVAGFIAVTVDRGDAEPVITSFNTTFQADGKQFGQTVSGVSMSSAGSSTGERGRLSLGLGGGAFFRAMK